MLTIFPEVLSAANSYLICRFDSCYLIDPSHDLEGIYKELGEKRLLGILLTHAHFDHIHLVGHFRVPIYVTHFETSLLFDSKKSYYYPNPLPYRREDLDIKLIKDGDLIPFADSYIKVIETPGHTKGSVTFSYNDKLFAGDCVFRGSVGRWDLYSGHLPDLKKSVVNLINSFPNDTKIYSGHGDVTTVGTEKRFNQYYLKWNK